MSVRMWVDKYTAAGKDKLLFHLSRPLIKPLNRRRWLAFLMPKCGSNSILPLAHRFGIEVHNHDLREPGFVELFERGDLNERLVFTFIRDPIERIYSAWRYLLGGGGNELDREDASAHLRNEDFDTFVLRSFAGNHPQILNQIHFRPMTNWITDKNGESVVDLVLPISQLDRFFARLLPKSLGMVADFDHVAKRNVSEFGPIKPIPISSESRDLLSNVYEGDLNLYRQTTGA